MGAYVVRTSSLNDKHSCQLFRKASSLVFLSSSVSMANLSCLLATTFSSLRFLFNFTSLQYFESGQALFLVVFYFLIFASYPQSSAFLSSVHPSLSKILNSALVWYVILEHEDKNVRAELIRRLLIATIKNAHSYFSE